MPVLLLVTPGHLAVAKDMQPATPGILLSAPVWQTFPAHGMRHRRIGEMTPGVRPFRVLSRQPAGASRAFMLEEMGCHGRPPGSRDRSAVRDHHRRLPCTVESMELLGIRPHQAPLRPAYPG